MRRVTVAVAVVASVALVTAVLVTRSSANPPAALDLSFASRALGDRLRLAVYLPRGYADGHLRYPVVYFLHGLPASSTGFRGAGFAAQALRRLRRTAILVSPQAARESEPDPEYLDRGDGDDWETAISRELPAFVDAHFRTIRSRTGRALIGFSAGGYGATLVAFHHLDAFAVVESWSGYFHATNPQGTAPLDIGSSRANRHASAHTLVPKLRHAFERRPTFFACYVGRGDARFAEENIRLHQELQANGIVHLFRLYRDGHARSLWVAHAREWLALALDHLDRARTGPPGLAVPAGFTEVARGPDGGTFWEGVIPNRVVPGMHRSGAVYLPPAASSLHAYPVVYLLHGFRGSPSSYVDALRVADYADRAITRGELAPFIAVVPVAGEHGYDGEWAGPWERYVVDDVVPWVDAHFPTVRTRQGRAIGGLSAGGYGGVAIGIRHPQVFGTLESWSGYFRPYRDGPFAHATKPELDAHDASLVVVRDSALLRRLGTRFFLSCGVQDRKNLHYTVDFARELARLGLPHRVLLEHGGHGRWFWKRQLVPALHYALAAG